MKTFVKFFPMLSLVLLLTGISNAETIFGDNFNDVGMFELAGTSVAMANAQDGVKELADIVLKHTNDEDGVAHYLKGLRDNA